MDTVDVLFLPQAKVVTARKGSTLFEIAQAAFIDVATSCNGKGTCGKCRIQLVEGRIGEPHRDELEHLDPVEVASGVRLACRCKVMETATFRVIGDTRHGYRILSDGLMPEFELDPLVIKVSVELPRPSLEDNVDDLRRVERAVGRSLSAKIPVATLRRLPGFLREEEFKATLVFVGDRLIGVEPGDTTGTCYGVAVDIGTTTVVVSLADLLTGEEVASSSDINPQTRYGLDVLSRIQYIRENPEGLSVLTSLIRENVDRLIGDACEQAGIDRWGVYEAVVAGNATMMHLFLGVDPTGLGSSPYAPVFTSDVRLDASDVDLHIAEFGLVYCLPSVSSYVGADIVAGLIATALYRSDKRSLLIDIGTNGEIVMGSKDGLFACSCAAGPAFEGMNISSGMRASAGAVERVDIDGDVSVRTVGDKPPIGLCGSGVIDAVAELIKVGVIERSGCFAKRTGGNGLEKWSDRFLMDNGLSRFVICDGDRTDGTVAITQRDVRQVQLAKGAIRSGVLALMNQLDLDLDTVDHIYIAGAFGRHVRLESLARLGVFPESCLDKVDLIGNSSKSGALLCLLSQSKRREASRVAEQVTYVELSCYPEYDRLFAECLAFPG